MVLNEIQKEKIPSREGDYPLLEKLLKIVCRTEGKRMPVRSMKLKLKTRSGLEAESEQLRKGLWRTHRLLNEGVAYYMNWLVMMRQEAYGSRSAVDVRLELLFKVREQQRCNQWLGDPGSDSEILSILRQLYELIVPSAVEGSGDAQNKAQQLAKYLSPLVDPSSVGGEGVSNAGRKRKWQLMKEAGDPNWEEEYEQNLVEKQTGPVAIVLKGLKSFGLKPLFQLFTDIQREIQWVPKRKGQFVRSWDRDMFQQAIERMLSWESWNGRVVEEYTKLQHRVDTSYTKHLSGGEQWVEALNQFEQNRGKQLEETALAPIEGYYITPRQVRGWDWVYEKWSKLPQSAQKEELWKVVAEVQTRMKGSFGDPKVFEFLAEPKYRFIWQDHPERILHFSAYNAHRKRLERAKQQATFTLPNPVCHPLWIRYEARGGSNYHTYTFSQEDKNQLAVTLETLLWPAEDGGWKERKNVEIQLAPSKQFQKQVSLKDNPSGKQEIEFLDYSANILLQGHLGGSKMQFERRYIEKRRQTVAAGDIGPVFLNFTVDVEPIQHDLSERLAIPVQKVFQVKKADWPKVIGYKLDKLSEFLNDNFKPYEGGANSIATGLRVMSIDMGQRTAAAVSMFEVVQCVPDQEAKKFYYHIGDTGMYAVHCRSLLLNLPGENVSQEIGARREERRRVYIISRLHIRLLSRVLRLDTHHEAEARTDAINEMLETVNSSLDSHRVWVEELQGLLRMANQDEKCWRQTLLSAYKRLEGHVGRIISEWRKDISINRKGLAGLSMWNIDELENTRKLLVAWSKRTRTPGQINRIDSGEKFCQNLLAHIQNVKDNRLKQMANLIVMTALGYKYDENEKRWLERYPACQVILFEDLSRYRFNLDRSRRENSKLMKWAHRSIPKLVWMQGEQYGLEIGDVYSAYSSRFHARTGAPGIRCHALSEEDLKNKVLLNVLVNEGFWQEEHIQLLKPGDIVPRQGGELFVSLAARYRKKGDNKLAVIHADINAAQNLQKRFWLKNSEVFRAPCQLVLNGENSIFIPTTKTIQQYLGKGGFVKNEDGSVYFWQKMSKLRTKVASTDDSVPTEDIDDLEQTLEDAGELRGEFKTLFRDPSGYLFSPEVWRPQKEFWSQVKATLEAQLRRKILSRVEA